MTNLSGDTFRRMIRVFVYLNSFILLFLLANEMQAQRFRRAFGMESGQIDVETITLPSDIDSVGNLNVLIRVRQDFFVFVKTEKFSLDSAYNAGIQISTDIYDEKENLVQSRNSSRQLFIPEETFASRDIPDEDFIQSFRLSYGKYKLVIHTSDDQSQREEVYTRNVIIKNGANSNQLLWAIIPLDTLFKKDEELKNITPLGMGGNLLFAQKPRIALQFQGDSGMDIQITIQKRSYEEYLLPPVQYSLHDQKIYFSSTLQLDSTSRQFRYKIVPSPVRKNQIRSFSLDLDTLDVGSYKLKAMTQQGGKTDSIVHDFRIVWKDMPRSLFNLQHAIESMRYILTDKQLDSMLSGTPDEQQQKFRAFWKKKDPTPKTIWNEYLVEYFRRVDEAFEKYRTIKTFNGAFTDRGRIHILFGPPEDIERLLPPDGSPQEIWLYPSLNKKFIFIDPSRNGSYYLKAEERL